MTTERDYINRASFSLEDGGHSLQRESWDFAILRASEAVEYSLRAALAIVTSEYPDRGELINVLLELDNHYPFPEWFHGKYPRFYMISTVLFGLSTYTKDGLGVTNTPPSALFTYHEADMHLRNAAEVVEACSKLVSEMGGRLS